MTVPTRKPFPGVAFALSGITDGSPASSFEVRTLGQPMPSGVAEGYLEARGVHFPYSFRVAPPPGSRWELRFKSNPVHFSVKGTVAVVLSRRRKAAFRDDPLKGGEDCREGRHK